ncbi:hypothetical protein ACT691_00910, partial [Vibrio metschnikovii]
FTVFCGDDLWFGIGCRRHSLVGYASLGVNLNYLIAAAFMSAPAGFTNGKNVVSETETYQQKGRNRY